MLNGLRILLAEDNPTNQLVASQMLESLGASVTIAEDGAEALEILERQDFDALLIDIEMPRVSGLEVLRILRASDRPVADRPMIALTAYVMREHREAIGAVGADGVIAKPILSIEDFGKDILRFMRSRPGAKAPLAASIGASASEPVNSAVFQSLADAIGQAAMGELLVRVADDLGSARERLERAVGAGQKPGPAEMAELRAVSHVLISVAGAIGAAGTEQMARDLGAAAQGAGTSGVADQARALVDSVDQVIGFVRQRLNLVD